MADLLASFGISNRASVEIFVERLIEMLDTMDGDPDLEDDEREPEETDQNGDEEDSSRCEDDARTEMLYGIAFGPLNGGHGL